MSIGLFAFAKGVADAEEDLYVTKQKTKVKKAEKRAEQAKEDAASTYAFMWNGEEQFRFNTKRDDSSDDTRRASGYALSQEIADIMEETTAVLAKPEEYSQYVVETSRNLQDMLRSPEGIGQINSWTSMATQDALKADEVGPDTWAYKDFRETFPHVKYFPSLNSKFESITSAGYKHETDSNTLWNNYRQERGGLPANQVENNEGEPSTLMTNRQSFFNNYGTWLKSGKDNSEELGYFDSLVDSFIDSDLPNNLNQLIDLTGRYYPKRTSNDDLISGYISGKTIDQTLDADIDKKAPIIIQTNQTIAKLTLDLQKLSIGLYGDAKASGDIDTYVQGRLPRFVSNFADIFFGPSGAVQNFPTFTDMIKNKVGNEFLGDNKVLYKGEKYTFDEFVNEGIEIKNKKIQDGLYNPYATDVDGKFKAYMDERDNKMTPKEAFQILEQSKTQAGYDAWKNTIGYAGLFAAKEIALAFNVAIMRQGFEGGKAVSDTDFQRSYDEVRAGGGILGLENMNTKIKYYSMLRNEMAEKALPAIIFSKAKAGVGIGGNYKHAASSLMQDISQVAFTANMKPVLDAEGKEIAGPIVGRQIPLALTIENSELLKSIMAFESGVYAEWLVDSSDNEEGSGNITESIRKASSKDSKLGATLKALEEEWQKGYNN